MLHARIPESLDDEIRQHAERLGVSVSNLVRNALKNAVGLVGDVVADAANLAQTVSGDAATPAKAGAGAAPVLGWQDATLNINAVCDKCNNILPKGTKAVIAVVEGQAQRIIRCLDCLKEQSNEPEQDES